MSAIKKTRVLYVNHTGLVSGAEKVLLGILGKLNRERFEPIAICPSHGQLADEIEQLGVERLPMPTLRARFSWRPDRALVAGIALVKMAGALRRQIKIAAPDLIHANSVRAGIAATLAAAATGIPVIWHVHDTLPKHPLSSVIRAFAFVARNTQIIAVSRSTAKCFQGWFPLGGRICTIHNGVDLSRFSTEQPTDTSFRECIGLSKNDFLVCAVGQICVRKGLFELIDALSRIRHEAPHIHLAIVGKVVFPHEEEYLKTLYSVTERSALNGHVHFTGELSDVSPVLQAADLLVLNSLDEPFGLVLIEAMASGTPVLATRVGGIPEIVTDSENGWLVEKADTTALASKLLELSKDRDRLARVAQCALKTVHSKFSIEAFQQKLEQLYARLEPIPDKHWSLPNRTALLKGTND